VIIPYMQTVYLEHVYPLPYMSIPAPLVPLLFQTVFGGFHYAVFLHKYIAYFNLLHPSVSFPPN
jgi:hypothetical protein